MNDKFLYQNRPAIRAAFVEELYQKINNKENALITFWNIQKKRSSFWLASILLFLVLAACVQKILGTNYHAFETIAKVTIQEVNYALEVPPPDWAYEPIPEKNESDLSIEEAVKKYNLIPLDEAIKLLPYSINLPSYLPEGFSLRTNYVQSDLSKTSGLANCLSLYWANNDNYSFRKTLNLFVCPIEDWGRTIKVAPGKWENISLQNDTPAILVKGSFPSLPPKPYEQDFDNYIRVYWDDNAGASLLWEKDGVGYWFVNHAEDITTEDLVLMAESMIVD